MAVTAAAGHEVLHPGSILSVAVDNTNPVAFGLDKKVDVFFDNNR